MLSPDTGELVYSSAGHPPPILVHADGTAQTLDDGHDIPLGLRPDRPRPEAQVTVRARATLLLYTDGLVERRREPLDRGIARAVDRFGRAALPPSTNSPGRSCLAWFPTVAIRMTSPCCFIVSPRRWR